MPRLARLLLPWLALWAVAVAVAVAVGPPLVREDLRQFAQPAAASAVDPAARQLVLQGAAAGLPESLYVLAMMKIYGHGEPRDAPAAVRLLQRAADLRHRDAQFALGVLFGAGDGVPRDDRRSAAWLAASAGAGHRDAKWMLAILLNEGRGVHEDAARALRLLREAADAGSAEASFHLGVMREYGRGAPPDFAEAARLYMQAARLDVDGRRVPDARYYLGLLHDQGRGVPRSSARAGECFSAAAEAGSAPAMLALARLHAQGRPGVVDVDYGLALRWLRAAAAANDPRVSGEAHEAARELQSLLDAVETCVREQERRLGVPLRVAVGQVQGGS